MSRKNSEKAAIDDLFISVGLLVGGLYGCLTAVRDSAWAMLVAYIFMAVLGGLWLSARIYHLTHKDEVFGHLDDEGEE